MPDLTRLMQRTGEDEGFESRPYKDTRGLWTFARGRCLETHPLTGAEWKTLLDQRLIDIQIAPTGADTLEQSQLEIVEAHLARDYADFWSKLGDARQNALIEMAYQMGEAKELAFHDMLGHIRIAVRTNADSEWELAKQCGLDSDWARETPARAARVLTQLATGEFQ